MLIARLKGIARRFEDGARCREVLTGIDLDIQAGELIAIVGPSGCGKTTLLTILGGLDNGYTGTVELMERPLESLSDDDRATLRNERLGFVFQAFHLLEHLTVSQNVEVPLWLLDKRPSREQETARAKDVLDMVGLGDRLDEPVSSLSGGERQRVAIARAMVNRPRLVLADEPTGNLDQGTGSMIIEIFDRIRHDQQCAVVVATHDQDLAARAGRVLRLESGRLA